MIMTECLFISILLSFTEPTYDSWQAAQLVSFEKGAGTAWVASGLSAFPGGAEAAPVVPQCTSDNVNTNRTIAPDKKAAHVPFLDIGFLHGQDVDLTPVVRRAGV
ncbi:MAG: hypothetical protein WAR22_06490, partial [Desulfomonilia bacterium]